VEDSGPGILEHELERIFEPFSRGSAGDNAGVPGTGLGLPISKMLTQLMGGELTVKSTPGEGSAFCVKLQLPRVHGAAPEQDLPDPVRTGYAGRRRKILVVDNEKVDRELLVNILTPLGFDVAHAASGAECIANYRAIAPDLILMDLAMPGIDGWEACRIIRNVHRSSVALAIVSANAYDKGLDNPAGIAASDFFVKPVNVSELLEWIGRRLGLEWETHAGPKAISSEIVAPRELRFPPAVQVEALSTQIRLGYMRGIVARLDAIRALGPEYAPFADTMRAFAARFQLQSMVNFIEGSPSHDEHGV
jgi:CheY-like chemotaxis protein